ncbi:MAG: nucleotidyltransferase [Clostridia bacterium]|nr:nucleotidyltransferase [Clostridia bacterium]
MMDLVVMAAGMGSRFGGLKQIEPIDEDNNFILDYSIYDAVRAGFDRVVLIIKEENYEYFNATIGKRLSSIVPIKYAFQSLDNVPKGFVVPEERVKPWGTAHALYCCKDIVAEKFAVINADDFYGYESFKLIADFLKNNNNRNTFISAGFQVKNTLSEKGAVKRGIFTLNGELASELIESEVELRDGLVMATPLNMGTWRKIEPDTLVSMTMFGFTRKLIDRLVADFEGFFAQPKEVLVKSEFLLPMEVDKMLKDNEIDLVVKTTCAKWYGVTYKEDLENFKQAIIDMKQKGIYPRHLY